MLDAGDDPVIRRLEGCVDYRSFSVGFTSDPAGEVFARIKRRLESLGRVDPRGMGVYHISNAWGFLVVPERGLEEIKVNFFRDVPEEEEKAVLGLIVEALRRR
jgi:hypothetical protein